MVAKLLLDTNVISATRTPAKQNGAFNRWLLHSTQSNQWLTTITMLELEAGILKLSRKDYVAANRLSVWLASVDSNFAGRVLSFDRKAASVAATILNGRTRGLNDCLIAGIAISNGLTLATRNTKDFDDIDGLTVVNPWEPK